jgi:hypothetical protein
MLYYRAHIHFFSSSSSFIQGFSDLVPLRLIKVFDERELEVSAHVLPRCIGYVGYDGGMGYV